jgi:secreted trypsin-like serine protease
MENIFKSAFVIVLIGFFCKHAYCQNDPKFIVYVQEYDPPRIELRNASSFCYATAISDRYVITTATCVKRIQKLTAITLFKVSGDFVSSQSTTSSRVIIHPNFIDNKPHENNLAIIQVRYLL